MDNPTHTTAKGTKLPLRNIKGKLYLDVAHRLQWFREERPDWSIRTHIERLENKAVLFKAEIIDAEGRVLATAHKADHESNFKDYIEKAETGAIGRALAMVGYGTQYTNLEEGERIADAPINNSTSRMFPPAPDCPECGHGMMPSQFDEGMWYCNKKSGGCGTKTRMEDVMPPIS